MARARTAVEILYDGGTSTWHTPGDATLASMRQAEKEEEVVEHQAKRRRLVDTDDALARLEVEVAARGAAWRIPSALVLAAPWDKKWKAGTWVNDRRGQRARAVAARRKMTPAQRQRFEALPYGVRR